MAKSTRSPTPRKPAKPKKPYPEFPLFPHATRRWAKKIRGKMHYFGPWEDPQAALSKYLEQRDDLHAGRKPRASVDGFTLKNLGDAFMTSKRQLVDAGELTERTWDDYFTACKHILEHFGKTRLVS